MTESIFIKQGSLKLKNHPEANTLHEAKWENKFCFHRGMFLLMQFYMGAGLMISCKAEQLVLTHYLIKNKRIQ
jgi:hypothetical protein